MSIRLLRRWCCTLMLCLLGLGHALAQTGSFGGTFIGNGGTVATFGTHTFNSSGLIGTARDATPGVFIFTPGTGHTGAGDAQHIDGYVQFTGTTGPFIYPVGDNGVYRPAATDGAGATVAYFNADPGTAITSNLAGGNYAALPGGAPFLTSSKALDVETVSSVEYWDINGPSTTRVSLTWGSASNVGMLTNNNLARLTIVGWNAGTSRWEVVPSTVDTTSVLGGGSSFASGSITSDAALVPNTYSVYTLAKREVDCSGTAVGVNGACLWVKADAGAGSGTLGIWQDQSGNGVDLTGINSPNVVAGSGSSGMNFNPVVRFNGTSQRATNPTVSSIGSNASEINTFFVSRESARQESVLFSHAWTYSTPSTSRYSTYYPWSNGLIYWDHGAGNSFGATPSSRTSVAAPFPVNVASLGFLSSSVTGSQAQITVNSLLRATGATQTATGLNHTSIGGYVPTDTARFYNGDIPELIEFERILTAAEQTRVQSYLALKYGLTLVRSGLNGDAYSSGSDTAVFSDGGTYWNNVFGIGRDTVTGLDQRVSRSAQKLDGTSLVAGDSPLTIATTADFTSANGGSRTALANGQYLVLGDNNGAVSGLTAGALGRTNNRFPRVWKAQNTGGVGPVYLGLTASLVNFNNTNPPHVRYLFVESGAGADGTFAQSRTTKYMVRNDLSGYTGTWVPVADATATTPLAVNIPDGAFVSYGTFANAPRITINKQTRGGVGAFAFTGDNGFVASTVTTTAEMQPVTATNPAQVLELPDVATVITETMPGAGWSIESLTCRDAEAATTGNPTGAVIGQVTGANQFTIQAAYAKAGADLRCTLINRYEAAAALTSISGRVFTDNGVGSGGTANDGLVNGTEAGRANVTVSLTNCSGTTLASAVTDAAGVYSLSVPEGTPSGNLCVVQTPGGSYLGTQGGVGVSGAVFVRNALTVNVPYTASTSVPNVNIGNVLSARLLQDNSLTGTPGSTLGFAHTFTPGTAGSVTLSTVNAQSNPALTGWSEVLYRDTNCSGTIDAVDTALGPTATLNVLADEAVCLLVQQFVPAGLGDGATREFKVQALFTWATASPAVSETLTRNDVTVVSSAQLQLTKQVRNVTTDGAGPENWASSNSARPGHTLEYRVRFTNMSAEPLNQLTVNDATPPYTGFVSAACPASPPVGMSCTVAVQPSAGGVGSIRWAFNGGLPAGASGVVTYRVEVQGN